MNDIAHKFLEWYEGAGRDLPWRNTTDPYAILVSEIMLQQTQVSRGLEYFEAWLQRFPDWKSLANASTADVLHAWAGLGYNRRALALHNIAKQVVDSGIPETEEEWLQLKGIGPYTAAALTMFSLRKKAAPVDTNIRRVLGRVWYGITFPTDKIDKKIVRRMHTELLNIERFYDVPQAIFDLANTHCFKIPDCAACPLRDDCKASNKFVEGRYRVPKKRKKIKERIREGKKHPDRIYRGRILKAVREGTESRLDLGPIIDPSFSKQDQKWVNEMINRMIKDGLIANNDGKLQLPS